MTTDRATRCAACRRPLNLDEEDVVELDEAVRVDGVEVPPFSWICASCAERGLPIEEGTS